MPPNTSRWPLARSGEPAGRRQARGQLLSGDARSWTGKIAQLDSHWIGDGEPGFGVPARVRTRARGGLPVPAISGRFRPAGLMR